MPSEFRKERINSTIGKGFHGGNDDGNASNNRNAGITKDNK